MHELFQICFTVWSIGHSRDQSEDDDYRWANTISFCTKWSLNFFLGFTACLLLSLICTRLHAYCASDCDTACSWCRERTDANTALVFCHHTIFDAKYFQLASPSCSQKTVEKLCWNGAMIALWLAELTYYSLCRNWWIHFTLNRLLDATKLLPIHIQGLFVKAMYQSLE